MCRRLLTFAFALWSAGTLVHCKSAGGDAAPDDAVRSADPVAESIGISGDELIAAAQQLRDREFEQPPEFVAVTQLETPNGVDSNDTGSDDTGSDDTGSDDTGSDDAGSTDRLASALFGVDVLPAPGPAPLSDVARYRPSRHEVAFRRDFPSEATLELALVTAIVEGLEHRHFGGSESKEPIDRRLATFAASHAGAMLTAAAYLFEKRRDSVADPVARVANRPELALRLAPLADLLERRRPDGGEPVTSDAELRARMRSFGFREGLALAAALHRAGGWSGVELLHQFDVRSTADVVRPDRWMEGRGLGSWDWPTAPSNRSTSDPARLGPALIAIWLGQKFRPELARTVYSGWRSDSHRSLHAEPSGETTRVEWIHQWDTPTSARQIARASRKLLKMKLGQADRGPARWRVLRKGIKVGVVVDFEETPAESPDSDASLVSTRARFRPGKPLPLEFEPTRTEAYRRRASQANIEDGIWRDSASQLEVDVEPARKWTFRMSRTLPLRWFARRPDGTVLQLSTELADPLGPKFGSDAYRKTLQRRFARPLESAEFQGPESISKPVESALHFTVSGKRKDSPWTIGVWQFRHGDVVTTVSLQAPSRRYESLEGRARSVYSSIETMSPPPGTGERRSPGGSDRIDYEIEEPER